MNDFFNVGGPQTPLAFPRQTPQPSKGPQDRPPVNPYTHHEPSINTSSVLSFGPKISAFPFKTGDLSFPISEPQPPMRMSASVQDLYTAITSFPDNKATDAEAQEIAQNVFDASQAFQVDPKVMLAIFAHESGGFNTDARSRTGAGGLGQLTDSAINETRRLSYDPSYKGGGRQHYPDPEIRAQLENPEMQATFQRIDQSSANRNNIHDNIWTATAYARIMMDRASDDGQAPITGTWGMLGRYNGAGGSQQENYDDKVSDAYTKLFNSDIPRSVPN